MFGIECSVPTRAVGTSTTWFAYRLPPRTPSVLTKSPHSPIKWLVMAIQDGCYSSVTRFNATIDIAGSARPIRALVFLLHAPTRAGNSEDLMPDS